MTMAVAAKAPLIKRIAIVPIANKEANRATGRALFFIRSSWSF
jgi:hypothetical protein